MAGHVFDVFIDPYSGLTASVVTSNIIDLRDALSCTLSWSTTSGTVSQHTLQVSNTSVEPASNVSGSSTFVTYTTFGTGTPAGIVVDTGFRYGRILRTVSGSSVVVEMNKQVG